MNHFRKAWLQLDSRSKLDEEEMLVQSECERRGIEVATFPTKKLHRRQLDLGPDIFVAGTMDVMHGAMKQLGIQVPIPDDYPACLGPWFGRKVWKTTLGGVLERFEVSLSEPLFVKPAGRTKCLRGL